MFNADMSSERVTVEWGFGKIAALWPWVDYRKNMKVLLQPVGMFLRVANVLTNMHTCMYGSEVSNHFVGVSTYEWIRTLVYKGERTYL